MKDAIIKLLTWLSGSTTLLAILHLIPIIFGAVGAVLWCGVAYYNFKKAKSDSRIADIELRELEKRAK